MLYRPECWLVKKQHIKIYICRWDENVVVWWMSAAPRKDMKKNICIHKRLCITLIEDKMRDNCLRWYRITIYVIVRRDEMTTISGIWWEINEDLIRF